MTALWQWLTQLFQPKKGPPPGSIRLLPPWLFLSRSQIGRIRAVIYNKKGDIMPNTQPTSWVSDNTAVATVDNTGLVTGVSAGACGVTALLDKLVSNVVAVTVTAVAASIEVSPSTVSVPVGQTTQLTAVVKDASGNPI
jgi:uncharacterized protein YjdB